MILSEKEKSQIIAEAIELALARNGNLVVGSIVGHKSRRDAMKLEDITENFGIVAIHPRHSSDAQTITKKELPINELFDINLVESLAIELTRIAVLEKMWQNSN